MEASIAEHNIKTFVRILQCASKFGDDLCMHANLQVWELAVTNSTKSAYFLAKLYPRQNQSDPGFFSRYRALGVPSQQRRGVKFKLLAKAVLAVIGKASTNNTVDRIDFRIHDPDAELSRRTKSTSTSASFSTAQDDDDGYADVRALTSKLEIKLVCKHGITKRHFLNLEASDFLRVDVDPRSTPSSFTIGSRRLREWLDHFSVSGPTGDSTYRGENQLGWLFGKREIKIRNWEGGHKDLCTEIKVPTKDFQAYDLFGDRLELTLPMKEFRATLQLADSLDVTITAAFQEAAHPLTLTSVDLEGEESNFEIFCAIATTSSEVFEGVEIDAGPRANGTTALRGNNARTKSNLTDVDPSQRRPSAGIEPKREEDADPRESSTARQRAESQRRVRPRLSMSAAPAPSPRRTPQVQEREEEEPLFLNGSQDDALPSSQSRVGPSDQPSGSQSMALPGTQQAARQMTQAESLRAAGLGDMGAEAVLDALDDLEDEEYLDKQQAELEVPDGDESMGAEDETFDISRQHFAPNRNIFDGDQEETEADQTVLFPAAPQEVHGRSTSKSRSKSKSSSRSRSRSGSRSRKSEEEEQEYESEEELAFPSTQMPPAGGEGFKTFFKD